MFNEEENKIIYEFITNYNSDASFKENVNNRYKNDISSLSIYDIYALEEIFRFGDKGIIKNLISLSGDSQFMLKNINNFLEYFKKDENFKFYKLKQLTESPESLSKEERFLIEKVLNVEVKEDKKEKENATVEPEIEVEDISYDSYTPILYGNDSEIRTTISNLFFGKFIHMLLNLPAMYEVKKRQKQPGLIADIDRQNVIEHVERNLAENINDIKDTIDSIYLQVKFKVLLGQGEKAFSEYAKYNTNITAMEIFEKFQNNYKHK